MSALRVAPALLVLLLGSVAMATEPTPTDLVGTSPLLLRGSRYIVTPDVGSTDAIVLRITDAKVLGHVRNERFSELAPLADGAETLLPMEVAGGYADDGTPLIDHFHRGLRVVFRHPNLLVYDESTGAPIYRLKPTWWSPSPLPDTSRAAPAADFRCPTPTPMIESAWIESNHQMILLRVTYFQPVHACGVDQRSEWRTLQLPFAPAPTDPTAPIDPTAG